MKRFLGWRGCFLAAAVVTSVASLVPFGALAADAVTANDATVFTAEHAKYAIKAKGYDVIGDPDRVQEHFEALARKDSQYFEMHAAPGEVKEARKVDKTDPKWGARIP